jgi:Flp pilus assembly protein TadD
VDRLSVRFWAVPLMLLVWGVVGVVVPRNTAAVAAQPASSNDKSWTESISSGFKKGLDKVGNTLNPKPSAPKPGREDDAISLKNTAKPRAELYIAMARVYEQGGKTAEAEQQYELALSEKHTDLTALLGYAQLEERAGKPNEAIQLYERAVKAHPQEASIHNNLGLCYARQNRPDDAVASMSRAIQLVPKNTLYRNNIAVVLVDQGKLPEALGHLREVHSEAAAYYNMGYLLNKKGQTQAALRQFELAVKADPAMESAKRWVGYLQKTTAQARLAQQPAGIGLKAANPPVMPNEGNVGPIGSNMPPPRMANQPVTPNEGAVGPIGSTMPPVRMANQPVTPNDSLKKLPNERTPRRLPPTVLRQPSLEGPSLPSISYDPSTAPAAPMPPSTAAPAAPMPPQPPNSALRPLPRVN